MEKFLILKFTIPVVPRTKKNSQQLVKRGNRSFLIPSKAYREFETECLAVIPRSVRLNIDCPINIKATYYVKRNARIDKTNLESALCDMLQKANVIADDSAIKPAIVVATDGSRVYYDKDNSRIEIEITPMYLNDKGKWEHSKEFNLL